MTFMLSEEKQVLYILDPYTYMLPQEKITQFIMEKVDQVKPDFIACLRKNDPKLTYKGPYIHIESIDRFYIAVAELNTDESAVENWVEVFNGTKVEFKDYIKNPNAGFFLTNPLISQVTKNVFGKNNIPLSDDQLDLPLSFYDEVKPIEIKIEHIDK